MRWRHIHSYLLEACRWLINDIDVTMCMVSFFYMLAIFSLKLRLAARKCMVRCFAFGNFTRPLASTDTSLDFYKSICKQQPIVMASAIQSFLRQGNLWLFFPAFEVAKPDALSIGIVRIARFTHRLEGVDW